MSGNQRELTTTDGITGMPKTVARQRLATTNENHRKRPAAKAGVAGSNPAGGTTVCAAQRIFLKPGGIAARHTHDVASAGHAHPGLLSCQRRPLPEPSKVWR